MSEQASARMGALPDLRVLPNGDAVAEAAATEIARVLAEAVAARGVAHWCTTGGSSAPPIYRWLSSGSLRGALDWTSVHTWWGDDRFVPPDHPDSNVLPFAEIMTATGTGETHGGGVGIPSENVHPIPIARAIGDGTGPDGAARLYAAEIEGLVPAGETGLPVFDLIVVGVGPDGHLLSVFPGSAVWDARANVVGVPAPVHIGPHLERVTLHPRLLAAAREVLLVTTGSAKAANLRDAWNGAKDVRELPVASARLPGAVWVVDEEAGAGILRG